MKKAKRVENSPELKKRAEKELKNRLDSAEQISRMSSDDKETLIHELQVHQIELKMQNHELRQTQLDLQRTRDRYFDLYDVAPVGYFTLSKQGIIEEANLTLAAMLGIERRTLRGEYFTRFIQKDDEDTFYLLRNRISEAETPQSCDLRLVNSDGQEFHAHLECMIVKEISDDSRQIRCAVTKITELKHAETAMRESEERFRSLVTATSQVVWTTNERGEVVRAIPSWSAFTGQSEQDTQGFGWIDMVQAEDCQRVLEFWNQSVKSKTIFDIEYRLHRYDGEYRHMLVRGVPVLENDGSVREWVGTCTDITERKRFEEALQESEKRLRLLSGKLLTTQEEERKRIARELHDSIGSSLSAIKCGVSNLMMAKAKDDSPLTLNMMQSLISQIQGTIDETRRIYMALRPSILDDFGILAAIEWVCSYFTDTNSNIHVDQWIDVKEEEIPEALKIVIFRVIQEGLNNIAKHSKAELVDISLLKKGKTIELSIEDNGIGFDVDTVSSARKHDRGIGLASMKERVELSGGQLNIETSLGSGTCMRMLWPGQINEPK